MKAHVFAALAISASVAACTTEAPPTAPPVHPRLADIFADDYTCKTAQASAVDFQAVVAAPERYYDKCIRLRALLKGNVLWENATALAGHQSAVEGAPRTIVLYSEAGQQPDAASHPYFVSVVGRLRSCSERNRRISDLLSSTTAPAPQGGEQYILTTLCYGVQGPAIFASAIDVLPTAMD